MSERERTDVDSIEFDFFDDSPTVEATRAEAPPPKRRRRLPPRPPSGGSSLLRLGALALGAILLLAVLVLWVQGCREDQRRGSYESYMEAVGGIGSDSSEIGRNLNQLVFTTGIQVEELQTQLDGLREAQSQTVRRAEELDPPGPLRAQHESLIEALHFRVSGLNGLARGFGQLTGPAPEGEGGAEGGGEGGAAEEQAGEIEVETASALLAEQADRLVASDVVYLDSFKTPAEEVMRDQGVEGIPVPDSDFVQNAEFASPTSWRLILERVTQPPTAGGLRGNRIAGVRAMPGDVQLSPTEENTVQASDRLTLDVLVENSGEAQETQVNVSLVIQQSPDPIRGEQTIDAINPGDTQAVSFRIAELGTVSFATRTVVKVTVEPVPGEENTQNNTAEYVVFFTVPG